MVRGPADADVWSRGSEWRRWDPHIHTPATLLNNQFGGDWDAYLTAIENATPAAEALGITDYCVLQGYLQFLEYQKQGRAQNVRFVFPNVEFRLSVETKSNKGINVHLLFSPEDKDHVEHIQRFLSTFRFRYKEQPYPCSPDWLIKLGRAVNPKLTDDDAALRHGADQFKLDWNTLVELVKSDAWARDNCLLAISVHEKDGVGGLKHEGSFEALREELKAQPHIIFSSNPGDRDFWLGRKAGFDRDFIEATYGTLKPCLHGSDAHRLEEVLRPPQERFTWIRAALSFTGLKQTLIEPDLRVAIGPQPPPGPSPSECIRAVEVVDAPWLGTASIELNDGLVAIVGPKGSGKTALADVIARAAGAPIQDASSFLLKAEGHLGDASATLHWLDNTTTSSLLREPADVGGPWVRYLSQQFVDRLCSSDDLAGELLEQIESVVFQAIADEDRYGATSFSELRDVRLEQVGRMREDQLEAIQRFAQAVAQEDANKAKLPNQQKKLEDLKKRVAAEEKELLALLPKDKKDEIARLTAVSSAIELKTKTLQELALRGNKREDLEKDYRHLRERFSVALDDLRDRYRGLELEDSEWQVLAPTFAEDDDLAAMFGSVKTRIDQAALAVRNGGDPRVEADLSTWALKDLQTLHTQLSTTIGIEKERARKHTELTKRLAGTKQERDAVHKDIDHLLGADARRQKAIDGRRQAYAAVFDTLIQEQRVLNELYAPLKAQLADEAEVERRLELHVRRHINLDAWVEEGERLLDLRKGGPFQGHGSLAAVVEAILAPAWQEGGADEVAAAMEAFIKSHMVALMNSRRADVLLQDLGRWLFSTDHVSLVYGLRYEGVDLTHLSPGMRGIVLLMLYLAIDRWDTRPLLVDQPEENLDPHSVYEELVRYFRAAKRRRQVILVTHNPNIVVNADADQVIVAASARKDAKGLPTIGYSSGGLEDKDTRAAVCRILEGGERAFLDRDRRYAIPRGRRVAGGGDSAE